MRNKLCFWVDCHVHQNEKIADLAEALKIDIDTAVGKLCRLWAWAKIAGTEDGRIGRLPAAEIAGIMRWGKKPEKLVDALVISGLLSIDGDGSFTIHDWYELNGKSTEKMRKDKERKMRL